MIFGIYGAKSWACNVWDTHTLKLIVYLKFKLEAKKNLTGHPVFYMATPSRQDGLGSMYPAETFTKFFLHFRHWNCKEANATLEKTPGTSF